MDDIKKQVDEFVGLPKAERREKYHSLPSEVKLRARRVIEARRGIAFRMDGDIPVLTKDEYINQILRQTAKAEELPKRIEVLKSNVVELKEQLQAHYGDEALAEAENALEEAAETVANQ